MIVQSGSDEETATVAISGMAKSSKMESSQRVKRMVMLAKIHEIKDLTHQRVSTNTLILSRRKEDWLKPRL